MNKILSKLLVTALILGGAGVSQAQSTLGVPKANATQSGIGLIRGWACDASSVEFIFDNGDQRPAVYGNPRPDTKDVCGDEDNGFELLINWNEFTAGSHNIKAFADGKKFADWNFNVVNFGLGGFPRGLSNSHVVGDFPNKGNRTVVSWSEAAQNFEVTGTVTAGIPEEFSVSWLSGQTLYNAFYGQGNDAQGVVITGDVPVVYEYTFLSNGTAKVKGLINGGDPGKVTTINYSVNDNGFLTIGDSPDRGLDLCDSSDTFVKAHFKENNVFDNVDLFFFNKSDALNSVKIMGGQVPECTP